MARMPLPNQRRHARKAPASASTAAASTVLEVDGLQLHVTRKRIKNLYLRIKPPLGTVEVSAPMRMSQRQIIGFAHERHSWIVQQQRQYGRGPTDVIAAGRDVDAPPQRSRR